MLYRRARTKAGHIFFCGNIQASTAKRVKEYVNMNGEPGMEFILIKKQGKNKTMLGFVPQPNLRRCLLSLDRVKGRPCLKLLAVSFSACHFAPPFCWKHTLTHCLIFGVHYTYSFKIFSNPQNDDDPCCPVDPLVRQPPLGILLQH